MSEASKQAGERGRVSEASEQADERGRVSEDAYAAAAAFAARLAALGVTDAVISPGSRSAPLALCFHACGGLRTWVQIDERSAGFFALGLGRATGRPAVLVCTSGTAAANYLPAVVEAHHAGVPLIACTADRPPERRGWGEPQTIDQIGLYRPAVRWDCDLPVPDRSSAAAAPGWAEAAFAAAVGPDPGPVHLNWPFREPLEPPASGEWLPENSEATTAVSSETAADSARPSSETSVGPTRSPSETGTSPTRPPSETAADSARRLTVAADGSEPSGAGPLTDGNLVPARIELGELAELIEGCDRGVVVAGPWPAGGLEAERAWAAAAAELAGRAGWPLIGEPIAHIRGLGHRAGAYVVTTADHPLSQRPTEALAPPDAACVVTAADHLLSDEALARQMRPDAVVMVGRTPTTKPVRLWLERTRPEHVVVIDPADRQRRAAPALRLTGWVQAPVDRLGLGAAPAPEQSAERRDWLDAWARLESQARSALDREIAAGPLLSALTARTMVDSLPAGSVLLASNSLPVRDLDAFVPDTGAVTVVGNRGASGIDGTVSTALGLAAADPARPVALYTGDLALLHDLSGLAAAARLGLHLTAVCVDNGGGGIFSLLPVADRIDAADFDALFRTPPGTDFEGLDGFAGIRVSRAASAETLAAAVRAAAADRAPGVDLVVVPVDDAADMAQRRALTAAAVRAAAASRADSPRPGDGHK